MFPFWLRAGRMMERGDFKYVLLEALKDKPMHGYEIMKVVGGKFGGFYTPSAGVVYPTLQMLEDLAYVTVEAENGKKVYSITAGGRRFLEKRRPILESVFQRRQQFFKGPKADLIKEGRKLAKLLFFNFEDLTDAQSKEIGKILAEAADKIDGVISQ